MTNIRRALEAAAAGGGDKTYVEDVFSTYLYTGTGGSPGLTITNGVNLADEGGLVWLKSRSNAVSHALFDTERGSNTNLQCDNSNAEGSLQMNVYGTDAFNTDGFDLLSANGTIEATGYTYGSWSFRKAPGFFDVVKWTSTAEFENISHNIGSVPGFVVYKCLTSTSDSTGGDWVCWHTSGASNNNLFLNTTAAEVTWGYISGRTSTQCNFYTTVGEDYVAYFFATDQANFGADSDESIIKCGKYTAPASGWLEVSLGWEVQYLIVKNISSAGSWYIFDVMREMSETDDKYLRANTSGAETAIGSSYFAPTADGFKVLAGWESSGDEICYIAIRRPMKVPEAATEVFAVASRINTDPNYVSNFVVDLGWQNPNIGLVRGINAFIRMTGKYDVDTFSDEAEGDGGTDFAWDFMDGWRQDGSTNADAISWMFRRAPEFMDVVTYVGFSSPNPKALPHNLTVAPEMIMIRRRNNASSSWYVWSEALGVPGTPAGFMKLNTDAASSTGEDQIKAVAATTFSLAANENLTSGDGYTYLAYLFATLAGISKVGSYTADGTLTTIDCGFAAGARFILIKRTDATGDWYLYDSHRGIVAGNDPYLIANTDAAEVTGTDYIDPDNSGFQITAAGSSTINVDTGEYIFLAMA